MPLAQCGDIKLEYIVEGEGPPLLMVRGLGGQASTWGERLLAPLRESFTVIRMNHRGIGLSETTSDPFSVQTMAADAAALLEALDVQKAHVFSVSLGGMVAQELALNHPERVDCLILGCTLPGGPNSVTASPETMAMLLPDASLSPADEARKQWPAITTRKMIDEEGDFLEEMIRVGTEVPNPPQVIAHQIAAAQGFDAYDRLPQINHRTLVMHGDADVLIPIDNARLIREQIPNATLKIVPGGAHMFFWEQPERTAEIVSRFLLGMPAPR